MLLEWSLLLAGVAGLSLTETFTTLSAVGLGLVGSSWIVRLLRARPASRPARFSSAARRLFPASGLEAPWLLFLASAAYAAWIAYDPGAAWLQFARLLAAASLFYAVLAYRRPRPPIAPGTAPNLSLRGAQRPLGPAATVAISDSSGKIATPGETFRARNDMQAGYLLFLAAGYVLAAALLAIYWVSQADFAPVNEKFVLLGRLGRAVQQLLPRLPGPSIHPNIAAGSLVLALPFAWEAARRCLAEAFPLNLARTWRRALGGLMILCALIILGGLALTASRGAALALFAVSAFCGLVYLQRRRFSQPASARIFWAAGLLLALAAGAWLFSSGRLVQLVGQVPDPTGSLHLRTWLWQQGWRLAQDYAFTGSGLMSFWMVNSAYSMLIGVPYIAHVHNSLLEVWIEQGLAGGMALLWAGGVLLARLRRSLSTPASTADNQGWMWAGMAAIAIAFFHGLVDVVFYVSRTLPLLGFVLGFALLPSSQMAPAGRAAAKGRRWALPALGLLALLAVMLFWSPLRAAWLANRGARIQTTLELRDYDATRWDSRSLRDVRQELDLSPATAAFEQALALDPHNRTALQRLAMVALARNEVESAHAATQQLWQDGRRDETTRLLTSDALLLRGEIDAAVDAARGLTWAIPRLQGHAWYDCYTRGDFACAIAAWQALQQLEPEKSAGYATQIEQARSRMKEGNP